MFRDHKDIQNLDVQILDCSESDIRARIIRVEKRSWRLKLRGFGLKCQVDRERVMTNFGARKPMRGIDLKERRKRLGYNQEDLMRELGIKSRQTISTWENTSESLPRILELALTALENIPQCRNLLGKRVSAAQRKELEKYLKRLL